MTMPRIALAAFAAFFGTALLPATAQVKIDMNKITCGDLLGYDKVNQEFVRSWMAGYYSASRNIDVVNLKQVDTDSKKVTDYCKKHKADPLPKAINKVIR
jgi:hypothetical protein